MSVTIFNCETPGKIVPVKVSEEESCFCFSQLFIVEKYEYSYQKAEKHFAEADTPYAFPGIGKAMKPYYGFDREPLSYTPDGAEQFSLSKMRDVCRNLTEKDHCEIIYVNIADSGMEKPEGMTFLGYDVCYPPDSDGFSAICDCMFLCRWHGCDQNGTEFLKEFEMLNENGLFRNKDDAVRYLYHYLSQDFAETGEFCILEIYR